MDLIVIDDETPARQAIRDLIEKLPDCKIRAEASSLTDAHRLIEEIQPDGIILDIGLPDGDAFDLLRRSGSVRNVIFVTADMDRAIEAFAVEAVDYLLKPVELARFSLAIERLRRRSIARQAKPAGALIERQSPRGDLMLTIKEGGRTSYVPVSGIASVTAEDDYSRLVTRDGRSYLATRRISDLEDDLSAPDFVRLTRSLIINRSFVRQVTYRSRDETLLVLQGHDGPIIIGRTGTARLRQLLREP